MLLVASALVLASSQSTAPTVLWSFQVPNDGGPRSAATTAAFNFSANHSTAFVFAMDVRSNLVARNIRSGAVKWNVSVTGSENAQHSEVRIGANSVFVLVTGHADVHPWKPPNTTLHAYKSGDGTLLWKRNIQLPCEYTERLLAAVRGVLFTNLCSRDARGVIQNVTLLALSEADGKALWSKAFSPAPWPKSSDEPMGGFHVVNDTVYVLNDQGLTAYDVPTGMKRWQHLGAIGPFDMHQSWSGDRFRTASYFTEGIRAVDAWFNTPPSSRTVYTVTSEPMNATYPCGYSTCTVRSVRLVGIDHASGKDVFSVPIPSSLPSPGEKAVAYVNVNQSYAVAGSWEGHPYFVVTYDSTNSSGFPEYRHKRMSQILHLNHSGSVLGRFELQAAWQNGGIDAVYPWSSKQPVADVQYSVPLVDDPPDFDFIRSYHGAFLERETEQQPSDAVQVHGQSCVQMLASQPPSSAAERGWNCPEGVIQSPCGRLPYESPKLLLRTRRILSGIHSKPNAGDSMWDLLLPPDVDYVGLLVPPAEMYCYPLSPTRSECIPGSIAAVLYNDVGQHFCGPIHSKQCITYTVVGW